MIDKFLQEAMYCTLSTVNEDGKPWGSPVFFVVQDNKLYWWSPKSAQHSKNIRQNGKVFITIFDTHDPEGQGKGLYIEADAYQIEDEEEIRKTIGIYNNKTKVFKVNFDDASGDAPTRFYVAQALNYWLNDEQEVDGKYIDTRKEVKK